MSVGELSSEVRALLKSDGELIATIAQDIHTKEILMLAWSTSDSLAQTIATGRATYWSRSRNEIWVKGETSGNLQFVKTIFVDCDGDALVFMVDQIGVACHTGEKTCFHREILLTGIEEK